MRWLRKFTGIQSEPPAVRGKLDARAYAIGDIHGRLDLLDNILTQIVEDLAARPIAAAYIVLLGDLIDRGPASAGVVERLRTLAHPGATLVFLMGNHEEFLLNVLAGDAGSLDDWLRFGGRECVESYGLDPRRLIAAEEPVAIGLVREAIPQSHRSFISSFVDSFSFGDYLFVHAGIRPGVALDKQAPHDLRWIREPFLSDRSFHGAMVVHGHSISDGIDERPNRIGIDTGAYSTGVLTALVVDGDDRRFLQS